MGKIDDEFPCCCNSVLPCHAKSLQLCPTLCNRMDCNPQAPLSMGFSRQEHWSGFPYPLPEDLPNPGIKPTSPALPLAPPEKPNSVLRVGHSYGVTQASWRNNEKLAIFLVCGIRDRIEGGHSLWKVKREAQKREYQSKGAADLLCQLFSNLWLTLELHMYETIQLKEKKNWT